VLRVLKYGIWLFFALYAQLSVAQIDSHYFSPGAKSVALGRSGVVGIYNPSAIYWNPASLAAMHSSDFYLSVHDPFTVNHASYAHFLPTRGAVGFHFTKSSLDSSAIQQTGFGMGYNLNRNVLIGGSINGLKYGDKSWASTSLGFLFKPEYSFLNKNDFLNSPLIANRLAFGVVVADIPLAETDFKVQTRVGLDYKLPLGLSLQYAHHFQKYLETSHMGVSASPSKQFHLYAGLAEFDSEYWAFGAEIITNNVSLSLTYDKKNNRAIFSAAIRQSQNPQTLADREYQNAKKLLQLKDRRGAYDSIKKSLAYSPSFNKSITLGTSLKPIIDVLDHKVDSLLKSAMYFEQRQKYVNAAVYYLKILKIDPRNKKIESAIAKIRPRVNYQTDVWYSTAENLYADGKLARAKDIFESIVLIRPTHSHAIRYLAKINEIFEKEAEEKYFRGLGFYSQRNLSKAKEDFQAVIAVNPEHEDAKNYLERIDQEIKDNEQQVQTLLRQAKSFDQRGSLSNARNRYQQILSISPGNIEARQNLAALNLRISQFIKNQYYKGERAFKDTKYTDAERFFRSIISLQSSHAGARRYLRTINDLSAGTTNDGLLRAKVFIQEKNWQQALTVVDSILASYPNNQDAAALKDLALLQLDISQLIETAKSDYLSGRYIKALSVFENILEKDPSNQVAIELKALCEKNLSDQVDEIFNQGIRLYTNEKYELAIAEFDKILKVNAGHKGAQEYKQRAQERIRALDNLQ
jgi:tetratricopeptide (TPR) repeat protein